MNDIIATQDVSNSAAIFGANDINDMTVCGRFHTECYDKDGNLKWVDDYDNLVTTQGKQFLLDWALGGTATAIATRMSLFTAGSPAAGCTYAVPVVTEASSSLMNSATRPTPSWGAATGSGPITKSWSSAVSVTIGAGITTPTAVLGSMVFVIADAVGNMANVGDTATAGAKLYSVGTFTNSKTVTGGDILNVSYTTSIT
jgi:hypothetical protein